MAVQQSIYRLLFIAITEMILTYANLYEGNKQMRRKNRLADQSFACAEVSKYKTLRLLAFFILLILLNYRRKRVALAKYNS